MESLEDMEYHRLLILDIAPCSLCWAVYLSLGEASSGTGLRIDFCRTEKKNLANLTSLCDDLHPWEAITSGLQAYE
jgi:hypothetical protein